MKIEFFNIKTSETIKDTDWHYFVMNNKVYCDNNHYVESQEATVSFEDFVKECPLVGYRIET